MLVSNPKIITEHTEESRKKYLAFLLPPDSVQEAQRLVYKDTGKKLSLEVKQYRKPRSNSANAFCWVLCQAIGEVVGVTKERVYRQHVRDVGPFETGVFSEHDAANVAKFWMSRGTGWITETMDNYDGTVTMLLYPGSSEYDTKQMSRLIDSLIEDCEDLGLDVQIPEEVKSLLEPVD